MASTDSNGILRVDGTDSIEPLHPVFNALGQSVSDAFDANTRIWPVATISARTSLYNRVGATASRPLFVWYSGGATGRQLMYTRGGNATADWKYYSSSEDVAESRIWRVANVTGRTAIFNSVGPGTTASPVMVWRADAPAGRNLEYNVTSDNAVANWHSYSSSQFSDDTGWVNITSITPLAGEYFQYRVTGGKLVEIRSRYLRSIAARALLNPMYTIPSSIHPTLTVAGSCYGGGAYPATGHVGGTGNVNIRNNHSATVNEMLFSAMYYLG